MNKQLWGKDYYEENPKHNRRPNRLHEFCNNTHNTSNGCGVFFCTLERGHTGRHYAHGGDLDRPLASWN